jgi:hypothetical protein
LIGADRGWLLAAGAVAQRYDGDGADGQGGHEQHGIVATRGEQRPPGRIYRRFQGKEGSVPYRLIDQACRQRGVFGSLDEAKQAIPAISDWRPDETGFRWDGWPAGAETFSGPLYVIELVAE